VENHLPVPLVPSELILLDSVVPPHLRVLTGCLLQLLAIVENESLCNTELHISIVSFLEVVLSNHFMTKRLPPEVIPSISRLHYQAPAYQPASVGSVLKVKVSKSFQVEQQSILTWENKLLVKVVRRVIRPALIVNASPNHRYGHFEHKRSKNEIVNVLLFPMDITLKVFRNLMLEIPLHGGSPTNEVHLFNRIQENSSLICEFPGVLVYAFLLHLPEPFYFIDRVLKSRVSTLWHRISLVSWVIIAACYQLISDQNPQDVTYHLYCLLHWLSIFIAERPYLRSRGILQSTAYQNHIC